MRIKEEFKRFGDFWFPSTPERKVPGILSISDGGSIELEVFGLLSDDMEALLNDNLQSIERIVGHIEKDGFVTLDDCYYKTHKLNSVGRPKSVILVSIAFTGVAYDEGESPFFNSLTFSIERIDEWVGISGIEIVSLSEERTATISYQPPEDISLGLSDGMQLLITFVPGLSNDLILNEARITQKIYFKLVSQDVRELNEFLSVVRKITTFLCFAIDKTVSLDGMWAASNDLCQDIGDGRTKLIQIGIYYRRQSYSKDEPKIYRHDMLFGFKEIQNDAENIINKWIEAYEQIPPAFNLYFSATTGSQTYLEDRFLTLVQGLEVYHRRTSDEKQMDEAEFNELFNSLIAQCPEEKRKWLERKLNYGNELSLRNRIKRIIEPFNDIIGDRKRRKELINNIVDTRNYLTHHDQSLESKGTSEQLQSLCLKIELLFQLHFLQLIGFSREQIDSIVANCRGLQWKIK